MEKFKLNEKQIEYLKKESDNNLVQRVLTTQNGMMFEIDVDTYLDFMEYIEDESVYWMDGKQEATEKTYMLESIRDDIFYQTN